MSYRILTKNGVDNTNIDGARNYNFNAGRRSGIVKGALNQGNFFVSSSNTIVLDTCELRLCGHRVVIDEAKSISFHNHPSVSIRYSLVAQIIVDNDGGVSFDLHAQTSSTALVQDNLDTSGSGTYELEIGRFTQLTDGTITDVVRTADLITGGAGGGNSEYIRIGTVTTNKISPELDADVDIENTINPDDNKPQTNFIFNLPTPSGTVVSVAGEEKTSINTDTTPTANSQNLVTSGGVFKYTNNISNPNLLINGDFRVNQRGQETYTGDKSKIIYACDRWSINYSNLSFVPATKTLTFNNNGSLVQFFEDTNELLGKTVTLSTKINGFVYSGSATLASSYSETSYIINFLINTSPKIDCQLIYNKNRNLLQIQISSANISSTYSIVIDYVKLEIGNIPTAYSPRPYAEELAMCQRYFVKLYPKAPMGYFGLGMRVYAKNFVFQTSVPAEMRTEPTMTVSGSFKLWGMDNVDVYSSVNSFSFLNGRINKNEFTFTIETATDISTAKSCFLRGTDDNTAEINLDAEIY